MAILREERIGNQRLLLGDCREVLQVLPPVDHIITDPPFSMRTHSGFNGTAVRATRDGSIRSRLGYTGLTEDDAESMARAFCAASSGWVVWFTDHALAPVVHSAMASTGRATFAPLPFFHPGRSCRLTGDGPSSWTDWIICSRTKALNKWGTLPGGYVAGEGWKDKEHMGGKPLKLMQLVVGDYSKIGETICDPCMGGATTLVACERMGRKGIGIEIDPVTFEKACRRVDEAARQPDLLIPETRPQPTQEAMDL
jgi:site-specific DNA-methyltransferase (adenine-specific)